MEFPTEITINLNQSNIQNIGQKTITIHSGVTTLLGPNGSGKTQILRGLKASINKYSSNKKIRYVSAGRLGPMENFRSDYDGRRGNPRYEQATYGAKDSMRYRHANETVTGDFATLSERPDVLIKVQERLRKLFNRDVRIDWDGGNLKVYFSRVDVEASEYSSAREASGLLHLVSILAGLYDDEVGVVLIDEPEVSLHPQLQSFLYQEISKVAGDPSTPGKKLVFLSTHSTEFIHLQSVDDLASIVFCTDIYTDAVQIDPTIDEFRNRKIKALLARMGQEHKLALFCNRPLLVEGPSDQIICSGISRVLNLNTEAAGSQILPVTGKGQMPVVTKLMRLIGKSPSILADADALTDGLDSISPFINQPQADDIAIALGHRSASQFARDTYRDFTQCVDENWIDICEEAMNHPYWVNRDLQRDDSIAKRRSAFCTFMNSGEISQIVASNEGLWSSLKVRFTSLLELLGSLGCFILKNGTIESYYRHADQLTSDEKPNAAAHEVAHMSEMSEQELNDSFGDIVEAIKFASQAKSIDEGAAIRDMVLAIVAPALASITETTTEIELNTNCKNLFDKKASLFRLSIENDNGLFLIVNLATSILDVKGFPLRIAVGSNPISTVNAQMELQ
ncbi:ATP-dependent nuclease [Vibrio harveyi]|uniref:ATP-dependent nuclease n=1 Tax=Vibrio harveyi TaxID=669 RepID=UPI003CF695B7